MKTTISILGTIVVLVAVLLGLLMVFEVIDGAIFKDTLGKVLISAVIVGGGTLAIIAMNEPAKPTRKK